MLPIKCSTALVLATAALINLIPVEATVQVMASNGCRLGVVYQPTSCTRCVCGLFNFMLCRQTCFVSVDELSTSPRPQGARPSGPTIIPILIPSLFNRRPFHLLVDETANVTSSAEEIFDQVLKEYNLLKLENNTRYSV